MSEIRDRSVVRSSVIPSAKYCCSGSLLRLANGSTTIDRRGAATGGGLDVVDDALVLSRRGMMGSRGWMRFSRGCGRTAIGWQRHLPPAASSGPGVPNQGRDGTAFLDDDTAPPTAIFDDALPWRIQVGAVGLCGDGDKLGGLRLAQCRVGLVDVGGARKPGDRDVADVGEKSLPHMSCSRACGPRGRPPNVWLEKEPLNAQRDIIRVWGTFADYKPGRQSPGGPPRG